MEVERDKMLVTVNYKLRNYTAEMPVDVTMGFLGRQLSELTGVVLSTMRLLIPKEKRFGGSILIDPASELHSSLTLDQSGITSGVVIIMVGETAEELKEVMKPVKGSRVLGFAGEEERTRARRQPATQGDAKSRLPKEPYPFHEFRVLELPNAQLNPPSEKARALLHNLAADPGVLAIMNWLNQEANELDWTNTPGRTLSGVAIRDVEDDNEPMDAGGVTRGHKLGGGLPPPNARSAAIQAARIRFEQNKLASASLKIDPSESVLQVGTLSASLRSSRRAVEKINEPDPDGKAAADEIAVIAEGTELDGREPHDNQKGRTEPDPDESTSRAAVHASLPVLKDGEPDPDDSQAKPDLQGSNTSRGFQEPDPDDMLTLSDWIKTAQRYKPTIVDAEPDPDESMSVREERNPDESTQRKEPDSDESSHREEPDRDESMHREEPDRDESLRREEPDPDESLRREEPDPDESMDSKEPGADESVKSHENGLGVDVGQLNEELVRILDTVSAVVTRLQQAVLHIRLQATPAETTIALNTLSTYLSNVVNNPNESKFKVIRKINHNFQSRVGKFEGALEFLRAVGFSEGEPAPGARGSDCFELKALDPALLWLALRVLQPYVA